MPTGVSKQYKILFYFLTPLKRAGFVFHTNIVNSQWYLDWSISHYFFVHLIIILNICRQIFIQNVLMIQLLLCYTDWIKVLLDMYATLILCAKDECSWFSEDDVVFCQKNNKHQRRQKKLKAYNLSSLLESLPELKAQRKPCCEDDFKPNNCKSRHKLLCVLPITIQ